MESLSTKQSEVLRAHGDVLVLGGPGSGKTTVGLAIARGRISAGLAPHQKILFLSFSNSAVHQILRASTLRLSSNDRACLEVHTFHGFCWNLLRSHGYLAGLPRYLVPLAPEREAALCSGRSDEEWAAESASIARKDGIVCFDLFAPLARRLLEDRLAIQRLIQSCFPLIIVDEFQDTDDDQWAILNVLTRGQRLIALADPHQRIYDFRPRVRPERLDEFRTVREATVIDLEDDNHRSPDADIVRFASHILQPERGPCYSGAVTFSTYDFPNVIGLKTKYAINAARDAVERTRGPGPVSIAVLAATNALVQRISDALRRTTPKANWEVRHDVFVDSCEMANAWHVALSLLDGGHVPLASHTSNVLTRLADFYLSQDTNGGRTSAEKLSRWGMDVAAGNWPVKAPLLGHLRSILANVRDATWQGVPEADVELALRLMEKSQNEYLAGPSEYCRTRPPMRHGDASYDAVAKHFHSCGAYHGASRVFERALLQDRLLDRHRSSHGCNLMTMHRCKGREYDAVVIVDGNRDPDRLIQRDDREPFEYSRRLLRVALTRARFHVHIIMPLQSPCPLIPRAAPRGPHHSLNSRISS